MGADSGTLVEIPSEDEAYGVVEGEVIEIVEKIVPGSAHAIDEAALERFESNDIHKVLAAVPGVYMREEDGYGLRPNIGMRGTGSERSAKIALMEDGILIAPAPYSAPAAYYFPMVTRMQRVEVLKGPAAIRHGPNTVGGAVNLITRQIPREREISLDLAGGSDLYGKLHLDYGESRPNVGWLIEGLKLRSNGFKELDGGGDTGFDKNGVMGKLRLNSDRAAMVVHQLDLKLGYSDEVSNETYTGLTDADFEANPYRRYLGTQLDRMRWRHYQAQASYRLDLAGRLELTATAYHHDFARAWRKLDGFNGGARLDDVLARPDAGNNAVYYAVLTGQQESLSSAEALILGTNDRSFVSQGAQLTAVAERHLWDTGHRMEAGLRLHRDEVSRFHYRDGYEVHDGEMVAADMAREISLDSVGISTALAGYYLHRLTAGDWQVTGGVRGELVATSYDPAPGPDDLVEDEYFVLIPGAGVVWQALPSLGVLLGVHKGFVPVSPGSSSGATPEESVNYEAGFRWGSARTSLELIGFFSDYQNLLGTCSFSSGCMSEQIGEDFNGGEVNAVGLESLATATWPIAAGLELPVRINYTVQRSRFQSTFESDNPQWGEVRKGDELPYLPRHQLQVEAGLHGPHWELFASGRYVSAMRDVAGQGGGDPYEWTDAATVLDLAASYTLPRFGKLYVNLNNVLDESHITSRRPYGARPGAPRLLIVGYKLRL
ncbi:TonB-dependent receptor family protein [Haliangium sp.]|uniref:TonB-dependent receptor family protein n=1 Tax=Haliangium sp. TaxID=2663208 RepID=UPI003D0D45AA